MVKLGLTYRNGFLFLLLISAVCLAVYFKDQVVVGHDHENKKISINGVFLPVAKEIQDFHLTDQLGRAFTKDNLKGRWSLVFFGFSNCGMVCPTTLAALNGMYKTLQTELPRNQWPQVVFITIDLERDTVQRLNTFIHAYNSDFIGARADNTEAQTLLMKQMRVIAVKVEVQGQAADHYSLDHSADILVFNPEAKLQASLSYPPKAASLVRDYELILMTSALAPLVTPASDS